MPATFQPLLIFEVDLLCKQSKTYLKIVKTARKKKDNVMRNIVVTWGGPSASWFKACAAVI